MVQILAEKTAGYGVTQIAIGGRDHAHIDRATHCRTDGRDFTVLDCSQEFDLNLCRYLSNFIQKDRATVGQF